uniref:serine carboxypeptidase-like 12 isoform X2 n=1 Tax=Erigeron canadensis TaxID=72917 RepID=UPI001CB98AF3|nr:serine carboxypeptidase-like 12 isoform X2 [Erigeron canadensis]
MYRLFIVIITIFFYININIRNIAVSSTSSGKIDYLPGFHGPLPFHLETGYVGVDVNEDVQLFYYFIQSESNPKEDPLMLWITGGPGCSSISGLFYEIGTMQFEAVEYNGSLPNLILTPYSWTKAASIIFLDIPVGTGFSYARTTLASSSTDIQFSDQAYEFMIKWFQTHPEFVSNPFYVGGDSYSGIAVPIITQLISNGNEAHTKPYINLKGYVLGNPVTFPEEDNYQICFANGMGLISDELYKCIDGIETAHVLEPYCGSFRWPIELATQKQLNEERPLSSFYCRVDGYKLVYYWVNDVNVREALHIRKGTVKEWIRCSSELNLTTTVDDVRPYHLNLSKKGYRSLIYSGDHDMVVPHQSTEAWVKDLNHPVIDQWRSWKVHGQIAGYTESYSNMMTFATVKGGGHTAPEYKPNECFDMFKRWISHEPL